MSDFSIGTQPDYVWEVLGDLLLINPAAKIHLCPWSPVSTNMHLFQPSLMIDIFISRAG